MLKRDKFIDHISHGKRYSYHTIKAYERDLEQFSSFLVERYEFGGTEEISHHMVRSWLVQLLENGLTGRSIQRKISTLKSYFRFMVSNGFIASDPMGKVTAPRAAVRLPEFVDQDDIMALLDRVNLGSGFAGARDRLVIEMLYGTGMRVSELAGLMVADIDFQGSTIRVTGKRNKQRMIPLGPSLLSTIENYLAFRNHEFPDPEYGQLILTDKGRAAYVRMLYNIVNRSLALVSTVTKKSPHILRHTFATHMLNNGADLNAIKEILGHASLAATQVYTHNNIDKLKSIYKQAHPRA